MISLVEVLTRTETWFREREIPSPRLDAELILCHILDVDRIQLYLNHMQSKESEFLDDCNEYCHVHVISKLRLNQQSVSMEQMLKNILYNQAQIAQGAVPQQPQPQAVQVEDGIGHALTRAVPGDVTAAVRGLQFAASRRQPIQGSS